MTASHRFPRDARVRAKADFDRIFKHGRRVALPVLALHWLDENAGVAGDAASSGPGRPRPRADGAPRLGLAVSRKVDPRAVGRNRIKRALRETFRQHRAQLAPAAYVVVARPGARALSGAQLADALLGLLRRAGALGRALPLPAPAGTMPAAACASPDAPPSG